jgi:ribosomal protein L22
MTRSSTYCLSCDAAVLPAGAVCIGAGADGLVIKEIASDRGLFLSKFERKLRGGAQRVMRTLVASAVIVKIRAGYG